MEQEIMHNCRDVSKFENFAASQNYKNSESQKLEVLSFFIKIYLSKKDRIFPVFYKYHKL